MISIGSIAAALLVLYSVGVLWYAQSPDAETSSLTILQSQRAELLVELNEVLEEQSQVLHDIHAVQTHVLALEQESFEAHTMIDRVRSQKKVVRSKVQQLHDDALRNSAEILPNAADSSPNLASATNTESNSNSVVPESVATPDEAWSCPPIHTATTDGAPVLVLSRGRPQLLQRTLSAITRAQNAISTRKHAIIISEDVMLQTDDSNELKQFVESRTSDKEHYCLQFTGEDDLVSPAEGAMPGLAVTGKSAGSSNDTETRQDEHSESDDERNAVYYRLAAQVRWSLEILFARHSSVIILHDNMLVDVDFFPYFETVIPLLRADPTLYCASAANGDDVFGEQSDLHTLLRTNIFNGKAFVMTNSTWQELRVKWPNAFYIDWMQQTEQQRGRHVVVPERSRARQFIETTVEKSVFVPVQIDTLTLSDVTVVQSDQYQEKHAHIMAMADRVSSNDIVETVTALFNALTPLPTSSANGQRVDSVLEYEDEAVFEEAMRVIFPDWATRLRLLVEYNDVRHVRIGHHRLWFRPQTSISESDTFETRL